MGTILKSRMQGHPTSIRWPWRLLCLHTQPCFPFGNRMGEVAAENSPQALFLRGPVPRAEEFLEEQMFPMKGPDYGPGGERDSRAPWLPGRGRSPRAPESGSRLVNGTHTHLNSQLLSGNCQVGPWLSPSWSPCSISIATASPSSGASPGPARPSPAAPSASHLSGWEPGLEFVRAWDAFPRAAVPS